MEWYPTAPIIKSLLENDLYKFSMGQVIFHQFTDFTTTWTFKCRNKDVFFRAPVIEAIKRQIDAYCNLSFKESELQWMKENIKWLDKSYIDFLRLWHPRREEIDIRASMDSCGMSITATGSWLNTSMYEVPILAIVSEVYYAMEYGEGAYDDIFKENAAKKIRGVQKGEYQLGAFSEFGMRRRYSARMQGWLVENLLALQDFGFVGTSNVYLAKGYNIKPCGTMAHEFIMCSGQGRHEYNPAYSNKFMMEAWTKEYGVQNGIALTDTITTDCFLRDFDLTYATLFSGVRHDSNDPYAWAEKMIAHYKSLGIDPKTKTLLFSDSLNFEKATKLYREFKDRAKVAFGIGTYLSCDCGYSMKPLNIVMKVTDCNGQPCAKISDVEGKGMCPDEEYVKYLKRAIAWRMEHKD